MPNMKQCCEELANSQVMRDCIMIDEESGTITLDKYELTLLLHDFAAALFQATVKKAARTYGSFKKLDAYTKIDVKQIIMEMLPPQDVEYSLKAVSTVQLIPDNLKILPEPTSVSVGSTHIEEFPDPRS